MRRATVLTMSTVLLAGVLALDTFTSSPAPAAPAAHVGNLGLTGPQMRADMIAAAGSASALLIKGRVSTSGTATTLYLQLNKSSASGDIRSAAADVPFVAVNGISYVQFTASLVTMSGQDPTSPAGKQLLGEWVPSTSQMGSSVASSIAGFTSLNALASTMLTSPTDTITADGTATVDGRTVAQYKDTTTSGSESEFSLPLTGPALPVQEVGLGANSGTVTFTWNYPTTVTAPPANEIYSGS